MTSQRAGQLQNQWSSLCLETLLEAEFAMMGGRGRSMYFWTPSVGFDPGPPKDMGPNKGPILFPNPTPVFESLKIWDWNIYLDLP